MTEKLLQWHPAFFAGIQIEFGEEAKYLEFKSEYVLGTKPMMIDVLIKKKEEQVLKRSIGINHFLCVSELSKGTLSAFD